MMELGMSGTVIPFPRQLRVVPAEPVSSIEQVIRDEATLIDHDGRPYELASLIRHLSEAELREVGSTAPRSGQALWDEVMRRWPGLAAEIVAGNQPAE